MENVDLYSILQVPKNVSPEELKRAYKKLCIQHHPDKGGDENEFKKVSEAYNILKDPEKRQVYDRFGMDGLRQGAGGVDENMQSMMENLFGFKFPFGNGRPGTGPGPGGRRPERVQHVLEIPLEHIVNGHPKFPFRLSRRVLNRSKEKKVCNVCKGQGFRIMMQNMGFMQMQQQVKCPQCQGERYENGKELFDTVEEEVFLEIPRNCAENHAFILKNRMDDNVEGESRGDVVILVKYAEHPKFRRDGADLTVSIPLSYAESVCGFASKITLLNGTVIDVSFPSMVRWNQRLCIPGKGLFLEHRYGNLFVEFDITYPDCVGMDTLKELEALFQQRHGTVKAEEWTPDTMKLVPLNVPSSPASSSASAPPRNASHPPPPPRPPVFQGPPGAPPQAMECHQQ